LSGDSIMYLYGKKSNYQLSTCHPQLQLVFHEVLRFMDHSIIQGHRGKEEQNRYYRNGFSKLQWPDGNHNNTPSTALDAQPYPFDPETKDSKNQLQYFGGVVLGVAFANGIILRWGGDWNRNHDLTDQTFFDLFHFELVDPFPPLMDGDPPLDPVGS